VCQAVSDLDRAFRNFFEGCASFPRFRKRGRRDSFSTTRTRSSSGQSRGASSCRKPAGSSRSGTSQWKAGRKPPQSAGRRIAGTSRFSASWRSESRART
jgi:hypothetical protein